MKNDLVMSCACCMLDVRKAMVLHGSNKGSPSVRALCRMTKEFPEADFGPNIPFREYSLLDNPKANVKERDIVKVTICQACPCLPTC